MKKVIDKIKTRKHSLFVKLYCFLFGTLILVLLGSLAYNQFSQAKYAGLAENQGILTVTGTAQIKYTPNKAEVYVSFSHIDSTSEKAKDYVAKQVEKALNQVYKLGVKKQDVDTTSFTVNKYYTWDQGKREYKGYKARENLQINVDSISLAQKVVSVLSKYASSVNYSAKLSDQDKNKQIKEAELKALANARKNAKDMASVLGVHLGKVISVQHGSRDTDIYMPVLRADSVESKNSVVPPLPAGQRTKTITVTVKYKVW